MPVAFEGTPVPVVQSGRYLFGPGCLPVWATRWVLEPALLTMQPIHSYCQRRGSGGHSCIAGSSFGSSLLKNSSTLGSNMGSPLRSPSSGCNQSVFSGAQESSISMACDSSMFLGVVSTLEFKLPSSKVTCLLGCMGAG